MFILAELLLAALALPARASTFLVPAPPRPKEPPLLEVLERLLGSGARLATEDRLQRLEDALRPTFLALPKGSDGGLSPEGVRYLLHRSFAERHGWSVRGLESGGEAWNSSSPAAVFEGHTQGELRGLFEARLGRHGFNLHHVAVLAAMLEGLVHTETVERLRASYRLVGLSGEDGLPGEEQVAAAFDAYMLQYVLGANHTETTPEWLAEQLTNINNIYPTWPQTRQWARQVHQEVVGGALSFNASLQALEAIGDRYGRWQDRECRELKASLLALEEPGTGRVRLDAFYQSALDGNWQFSESRAYLRQLGTLDESDPAHPSVVIPNYVNAPSNCVASSSFYSVCCIDECEALLGHLEARLAAPDAPPERIAVLVAELPSATTKAPWILPGRLVRRLEEIAAQHGGAVPLHGRLFAQWLHHAYPRECPQPHLSGTVKPLTPEAWTEQTGELCSAREEEMRWHVEAARGEPRAHERPGGGELPWSGEEELFVGRRPAASALPAPFHPGRTLAALTAVLSLALLLLQTLRAAAGTSERDLKQSYCI